MSSPKYEALTELIDYVRNQSTELGLSDSAGGPASFWKDINSEDTWRAPMADTLATGAGAEVRNASLTFTSFLTSLESERAKFSE